MPPKPKRRAEEDAMAGADYLVKMRELGPRDGESQLAFEIRIAGVERGRDLVLGRCLKLGSAAAALSSLGIGKNNSTAWLRRLGLTMEQLEAECAAGRVYGLPRPKKVP